MEGKTGLTYQVDDPSFMSDYVYKVKIKKALYLIKKNAPPQTGR